MEDKKNYIAPELIELGSIQALTHGPGWGFIDSLFGIGDGDGGWLPPYKNIS